MTTTTPDLTLVGTEDMFNELAKRFDRAVVFLGVRQCHHQHPHPHDLSAISARVDDLPRFLESAAQIIRTQGIKGTRKDGV